MKLPAMNSKGRFELKEPFSCKPDVIYEVTAIREFSDLYYQGVDVYREYYVPAGLINGVEYKGSTFNFNEEVKQFPSILTLEGTDRTIIYVPSTYVVSFPEISEVSTYSRLIMSVDLGALPDNLDLSGVIKEVNDMVSKRVGINAQAVLSRAYTPTQPTREQHITLENTRLGNIKAIDNTYAQKEKYKAENVQLQKQIKTLLSVLRENGLLNKVSD